MKYKFTLRGSPQLSDLDVDVDVDLVKSFKQFSKKPVAQIQAVPELKIIISLCDGLIHVNGLDDLSIFQVIQKTRGATCFATNLQTQETLTGELQYMLRLCVVVKKKIILLYWKNKNFHEMDQEFNLQDQPRTVAWCSESIFVGFKSEYALVKVESNKNDDIKTLSATGGKQHEPTIRLLHDDKLTINRDENTYILDQEGDPCLNYSISWSDVPTDIAENCPYLVALLPSSIIEVRTIEPHLFIQRIELAQMTSNYSKVKFLTNSDRKKGMLIAASINDIFAIAAIPIDQQKAQMITEKHFELALRLANLNQMKEDVGTRDIELQYAHDLFHKNSFKEALNLFYKLDISPLIVIELFPDLSDEVFTQADEDDTVSVISGNKNESGPNRNSDERITALIDYLIQIRRKISVNAKPVQISATMQNVEYSIYSHMKSPRALERLRQEVDTTLLKCYLKTKNALVASLLRLPDNHCKLQVTEKALLKYHKYNELIILYRSRGLHRKALEQLKIQCQESPASGYEKMVQYLQHLGKEHLEIICEYARWILKDKLELGLKIFTADLPECEQLDRNLVLEFLRHNAPQMEIPYLEHLIHFWNDKTSFFHTTLLLRYRQRIAPMLSKYIESLNDQVPAPAGQEPGELGELRRKLLDFLEISDQYTTQGLPVLLLNEGLCEERAIVVGKLGQHEEALSIFIYVLNNPKRAEEYCQSVYIKKLPNSKDIFFLLLKLYLHPPETFSSTQLARKMSASSASQQLNDPQSNQNFTSKIMRLLNEHGDKIDPHKAIAEIPNDFDIIRLKDYLGSTFKRKLQECHEKEMFRQLILSKFYQVQKTWIELQRGNKIVIDDSTSCQVCNKKIGRSAFVRFPNLDLVHYSCRERYGKVVKAHLPFFDNN